MSMNEAKLRQMMQEEAEKVFDKKLRGRQFTNLQTPRHVHNGSDAPRIKQADILPNAATTGSMTFATTGRRYKVKLTFNPTYVFFNGLTTNNAGNRTMVVGAAFLGPSFYLQEDSVDQVVPGPYFNVVQSCTAAHITGLTGIRVHEGHLVRVQDNSAVTIAELTIPNKAYAPFGTTDFTDKGYEDGYLYLDCYLASGYEIIGNIMIN